MSARDRSRQRANRLIQKLKQGTVSMNLMDAEMTMFKRFVEERDRDTAHVTAAPPDTAQYRSPRSHALEVSFDTCGCVDMEEKYENGRMNPELTELESPSAVAGLETPYWKECLVVKRQGQWLLIHYTIKKKIMVCRVVGDRGQLMVRQNALKIRSWADVFGLKSGVTPEGWTSLFFLL